MKNRLYIQFVFDRHIATNYVMALLVIPVVAHAQRQKVATNMVWIGHYSTIHLTDRFSVTSDLQIRTGDWVGQWSQQLIRSGVSYKLNSNLQVTVGGAWFRHAVSGGDNTGFRNEWRPWQEISYGLKRDKPGLMQRLRLEQRFLQQIIGGHKTRKYAHTTRLRYRLEVQLPLKGTAVSTSLVNEFMVNPGYLGRENFLDQNRTFAGINVKVSPTTMLQAQYMKIFLWRTNNILEDQNVVRVNIHQQFNRKK